MKIKKVSVIGLGKLGLPMAICFANSGFKTVGVDKNEESIRMINNQIPPFYEPGLAEQLLKSKENFSATSNISEAIKKTDATFIIVPTPSEPNGSFSNKFLETAIKEIASVLKTTSKYHLIIINSTVTPTSTDKKLIPLIEKFSNKKINKDFGVCYNPEFIALGSVIENFLNPDLLLIGESDKKAGNLLESFFGKVLKNNPYVAKMSIVSAEIMKISLNAYVTMKISFANNLSLICSQIEGAEIDKITKALGSDKRIGRPYLKSGLGYGGPCFPRDNRAFKNFAQTVGYDAPLSGATDEINNLVTSEINKLILKNVPKNKKVIITGAAYKDETSVLDESPSLKIISRLIENGYELIIDDKLAEDNVKKIFGETTKINYKSLKDSIEDTSACILVKDSQEHKKIIEKHKFTKNYIIIDCWRMIDSSKLSKAKGIVKYIPLGQK